MKIWENIVIGSGPGGATTALTLAENGHEVLVLEEGHPFPVDETRAYGIDDMLFKYRNGGVTAAFGKPKVAYVEGSLVGGGSEVNAGLYHRTPNEVLQTWSKDFDCQAVAPEDLKEHFEHCEKLLNIQTNPNPPPPSLKLKQGANILGWNCISAPRWIQNNERQSMSRTLLPAASSYGADLRSGVFAHRIRQNASGWEVSTQLENFICKNLYLCAGAIATPSLLLRSGITHNIGRSLQMHPSIKLIAHYDEVINGPGMGIASHQVKEFSPTFSIGCSISSLPYLGVGLIDHADEMRNLLNTWQHKAIYYSMIRPEAKGRIINLPLQREPFVQLNLTETDFVNIKKSFDAMGRVLLASGARKLFASIADTEPIANESDFLKITPAKIRKHARLMTIHLFSSCPMGERRQRTATDSFGRVWGYKNLFINDASLLCNSTGVNPQGSVMAIARRNIFNHLQKG